MKRKEIKKTLPNKTQKGQKFSIETNQKSNYANFSYKNRQIFYIGRLISKTFLKQTHQYSGTDLDLFMNFLNGNHPLLQFQGQKQSQYHDLKDPP